jgi:hypothetical protein
MPAARRAGALIARGVPEFFDRRSSSTRQRLASALLSVQATLRSAAPLAG